MLRQYSGPLDRVPILPAKTLRLGAVTIRVTDMSTFEKENEEGDDYFGAFVTPCSSTYLASVKSSRTTPLDLNTTQTPPKPAEPDLSKIPTEYSDLRQAFIKGDAELPAHGPHDLGIDLEPGKTPPFGPLYSLSADELKLVHDYLVDMLARGLIRVSNAPCGAPILFARKKDGSLRLCVDYRRLNNITIKNVYPLPLIHELLDRVSGSSIFSKLDLTNAYWHIRIREGDEYKTAFRTRYGLFEYLVMPFGLSNAPGNFQAHINACFSDMLDVFLVIYLDDLLIFSKSKEEHVHHVRAVLQRLIDKKLSCNPKKCAFHTDSVEFLGYILSKNGVSMCPERVRAISEWTAPTNSTELRSFLGFANFYRGFIDNYSKITTPLTALFKTNTAWRWTSTEQNAFDALKAAFVGATVVAHYNPDAQVILETDASDFAISGVASQEGPDGLRPIGFYSRKLRDAELNYDTHDKELLAIMECVKAWRHWLQGRAPFVIYTDHENLKYFQTTKVLNRRQVRWSHSLADFNFTLLHRPGTLNGKADALSRKSQDALGMGDKRKQNQCLLPPKLFSTIAATHPAGPYKDFEARIRAALPADDFYNDARLWLQDPESYPKPHLYRISRDKPVAEDEDLNIDVDATPQVGKLRISSNGLLYHGDSLYVPKTLHLQVLTSRHDSPLAGHFAVRKTLELITRDYWWPQIATDVAEYIKSCEVCQRSKSARRKPRGLLHPLPTPSERWENVTMDFITGLPLSDTYDAIMVVVDRFTKMAHFIPTDISVTSERTAQLYIDNVFKLHGLPKSIISDRGPQFDAVFWQQFWKQLKVKRTLSTAYHPQTDGQTERVNSIISQYLRSFVDYQQLDWTRYLALAEFTYNNTVHSATKVTPFYADTGRHPRFDVAANSMSVTDNPSELASRIASLGDYLKEQIEAARLEMAKYADVHRLPAPIYKPGDKVYVSSKNIRTKQRSSKLGAKQYGPFEVETPIGHDAYRLILPDTMKIHPVFHTSLLSPHLVSNIPGRHQEPPAPVVTLDGNEEYEIDQILTSRYARNGKVEYHVKWLGYDDSNNEWVPKKTLKENALLLLAKFHDRYPDQPGPGRRPKNAKSKAKRKKDKTPT